MPALISSPAAKGIQPGRAMDDPNMSVSTRITIWLKAHGKYAVLGVIGLSIAATAIWGGSNAAGAISMLGLLGFVVTQMK